MRLAAIAVALVTASAVGVVVVRGLPPATDPARQDGIVLLQETNRVNPSSHLPEFAEWPTREDLKQCPMVEREIRKFTLNLTANFDDSRHRWTDQPATPVRRRGFGFQYAPNTYERLCGRTIRGDSNSPFLWEGFGKIRDWWNGLPQGAQPKEIDPPFSAGMKAAAVGWYVVHKPESESSPVVASLTVLDESGNESGNQKKQKAIKIKISNEILSQSPTCTDLEPISWTPEVVDNPTEFSITSFIWIQLGKGERYRDGQCGDFLILTNFNLMKRREAPDQGNNRWLWAAYWWDPDSKRYGVRPDLEAAGTHLPVWDNYAMDATYGSDRFMFNPAREVEDTNCSFCHYAGARIPHLGERHGVGSIKDPLGFMFLDSIFAPTKME